MIVFAESFEHMIFGMKFYKFGLSEKSRNLKKRLDLMSSIIKDIIEN